MFFVSDGNLVKGRATALTAGEKPRKPVRGDPFEWFLYPVDVKAGDFQQSCHSWAATPAV
jgi:hypothetical protein